MHHNPVLLIPVNLLILTSEELLLLRVLSNVTRLVLLLLRLGLGLVVLSILDLKSGI